MQFSHNVIAISLHPFLLDWIFWVNLDAVFHGVSSFKIEAFVVPQLQNIKVASW